MLHRIATSAVARQLRVTDLELPVLAGAAARGRTQARVAASLWAQVALLLVAFGLRLVLVDRYPLREDEAIYGCWALHFWQEDPLFLHVWLDKPPLYIWLLSPLLHLAGPSAAAARWLNIAASTLTVAVVGATARTLWGRTAGLAAGLVAALSPFAVSFAATVYTDPLLVLWGALAFHAAVQRRARWAGLWLGAAIMTKQQGLLYVPLICAVLAANWWAGRAGCPASRRWQSLAWTMLGCLGGLALIVAPIVGWDSLRWHMAPSPWDLGMRHYGELRLASPAEWLGRAAQWSALTRFLAGSWFVWVSALVVVAATLAWARASTAARSARPGSFLLVLFLAWAGGFWLVHVITTVQVWDRYLLPLAPVGALLAGWVAGRQAQILSPRAQVVAAACALCLLLPPGLRAAQGALPVGGDHGDYAGLPEALAGSTAAGDDVVLYHRTLGWHARFYLVDAVRSGQVELRWFPNSAYLADNAAKASPRRKLLIEPAWAPERNLVQQLAARRLTLEPMARAGNFTVYAIGVRGQAACGWCRCAAQTIRPPAWVLSEAVGPMTRR